MLRCRLFYLRSGKCRYGRHRFPESWTAARSAAGASANDVCDEEALCMWNDEIVLREGVEKRKRGRKEEGRSRPRRPPKQTGASC